MGRVKAGVEERSIGRSRVFDGGGKRMGGCEPIIEAEDLERAGEREARDEVAMSGDGAGPVAAAVQIEHRGVGTRVRPANPFGGQSGYRGRVVIDAGWKRGAGGERLIFGAQIGEALELGDGGARPAPRVAAEFEYQLKFRAGHG
jgi:hypothetical protein